MLLRAYRVTDRLGVVAIKTSAGLVGLAVSGVERLLGSTGNVFKLIAGVVLAIVGGLLWLFNHIRRVVVTILGFIGGVALVLLNFVLRLTNRTAINARQAAENTMVRRSARAEIDTSIIEDPLRAQNRVLSGMVVVVLAALMGVVIWATSNTGSDNPIIPMSPGLNTGPVDDPQDTEPQQPVGLNLPTAVPTATALPAVLQEAGTLAFVQREAGQSDIWTVTVGSLTPIRIVNSPEDDRDPAWSNDGMRLAYASRQEDSNWDLYIYDLITGETTRMTYNLAFEGRPKWSPDDAFLVYEVYQSGTHLDIFVMRSDGSETPVPLAVSDSADFSPTWSPDGRRIAFVSWRDGNQDIYVVSLDDGSVFNLTNTPNRHEDYPAWSPDGTVLAYSAVEAGSETVFIKPVDDPNAEAAAFRRGRTPAWSPDGSSIVFAVDSSEGALITAAPYIEAGVTTEVIQARKGATLPVWTSAPLPSTLVNAGGLPLAVETPLYEEQVVSTNDDPPYGLGPIFNVDGVEPAVLSDRVNDSFNALRQQVNDASGVDFLGTLSDALWSLDRRPEPGVPNRNWHRTGRAFSFNRIQAGFPPPFEVVREDSDLATYWRVFVRVADEAQTGQLGEPLRHMPWDFSAALAGDVEAYDQGGKLRDTLPDGYYVDLTQIAADYKWERVAAGQDWRANRNVINYWTFRQTDGLDWINAMRELYTAAQLGAWMPTPTPAPIPTATQEG
jgi:TolB protein